ncbi:MAG: hypothetical protein PHT12_02505 [Patescibacteria group bacterium]|nr:hypothetical protein [Patescibacteria group bacterium]
MGNFDRRRESGSDRGGKRFGGGRGGFGGRDGTRPTQLFKATCEACKRPCEVPFRPTGEKPVYCRDCFKGGNDGQPRRFGDRDAGRSSFGEKQMFSATCSQCGSRCEVPFRPTGEKPVYCRACFGKDTHAPSRDVRPAVDQYKAQFETLNYKLDRIMRALGVESERKVLVVDSTPAKDSGTVPERGLSPDAAVTKKESDAAPAKAVKAPKAGKAAGKKAKTAKKK